MAGLLANGSGALAQSLRADFGPSSAQQYGEQSGAWQSGPISPLQNMGQRFGATSVDKLGMDRYAESPLATMNSYLESRLAKFGQPGAIPGSPSSSTGGGTLGNAGGGYAMADRFNSNIAASASRYNVPVNLLKSLLVSESQGNWERDAGSRAPFGDNILAFSGIKQATADSWGLNYWAMANDPAAQIEGMAKIISGLSQQYGGWGNAIKVWYMGEAGLRNNAPDDRGVVTSDYYNQTMTQWQQLDGMTGSRSNYDGAGSGSLNVMQGGTVEDWGEFNTPSNNGYYEYGKQYGLNGTNHTGLDILGAVGAPFTAAFSGHVVCAGTGNGTGEDSCDRFGYSPNFAGAPGARSGSGRVQIMSDDGNIMLIYGHALGSAVAPGQRVTAGQMLGWNGGMNSAHIHLEARVRDPNTPSGWRIVDPRTVMNGGVGFGSGSSGSSNVASSPWDVMYGLLSGNRPPGY